MSAYAYAASKEQALRTTWEFQQRLLYNTLNIETYHHTGERYVQFDTRV